LFPSLPLRYTIPLIIHYLDDLLVMRSSSYSPPFEQHSDGMVADRPVLGIDTDRVLAEENLPRPSLLVGSTPEMGFVKDVVYGHDLKLVALNLEVETLRRLLHEQFQFVRSNQAHYLEMKTLFDHFIDEHWTSLQQAVFISTHRQCPCGRLQLTECHCGRPRLVEPARPTYPEYFPPPVARERFSTPYPNSSSHSSTSNTSPFITPEDGQEVMLPIPYRLEGPTEEEALFLRAALHPQRSEEESSDEGDDGFPGGSG